MPDKVISLAIVDDHDVLRNSLGELLATLGYNILYSVGSGKELLEKLKTTTVLPDLCILDVNLPDRAGYLIAKSIKRQWPQIKILAFSVHEEKTWKKLMLNAGADFYLRKDAHPQLLHEIIQYLMAG